MALVCVNMSQRGSVRRYLESFFSYLSPIFTSHDYSNPTYSSVRAGEDFTWNKSIRNFSDKDSHSQKHLFFFRWYFFGVAYHGKVVVNMIFLLILHFLVLVEILGVSFFCLVDRRWEGGRLRACLTRQQR